MRYVCLYAVTGLISLYSARAEESRNIHADLTCQGCTSYNGMVVDIQDAQRNPVDSIPADTTGGIDFRGQRDANYFVTVRNAYGRVIAHQMLSMDRSAGHAIIRLPDQTQPERPASGTISVKRLQHKIPKPAKKEYERGMKVSLKGDIEQAIEHLKNAIELDPEFMEAHNDLGTRYMVKEDFKSALAEFRKAIELEPTAAPVQTNIAIALFTMREYPEAERAARRTIDLDAGDMKARLVLGLSLYARHQFTPEALDQLRRVQDQFPNARIAIAGILATRGDTKAAQQELKAYIQAAPAEKRHQAEMMLAGLQQ